MEPLNQFIKEGILSPRVDLDLSGVIQDEFTTLDAVWDDLDFTLDNHNVLYLSAEDGGGYYNLDIETREIQILKKYKIKEIRLTDEYVSFWIQLNSNTPGFTIIGESGENSIDFRGCPRARSTILNGWNVTAEAISMVHTGNLFIKDCTFVGNGDKNGSDTMYFSDCTGLPQMQNVEFKGVKNLYFVFSIGQNKIVKDFAKSLGFDIQLNSSMDIPDKLLCSAWGIAKVPTGVKSITFEADGIQLECVRYSHKWVVFYRPAR